MRTRIVAGALACALALGTGVATAQAPPPPDPPDSTALIDIAIEGIGRLGVNYYAESLTPICLYLRIGTVTLLPTGTCIL